MKKEKVKEAVIGAFATGILCGMLFIGIIEVVFAFL